MKGKFICAALAVALVLGPVTARAEGGDSPENEGIALHTAAAVALPFTDVAEKDWFHDNVAACYEEKIMVGTEATLFSPYGILREEETATLAARLRARQRGEEVPSAVSGESWYTPVLRYLEDLDLGITPGVQCTRGRFLVMLGAVLADSELEPICRVDSLPDSTNENVLRFYRAGILNGKDPYGTFQAYGTLTRAEAAAMVSRILRPELRKSATLA
ncbi:MAG: S-layer homology domain-containing protein, partial [Oscillospiraceae bacterium]|nr:S-layer homology domain-containing protein [Oscillospiraceae bacterium]